MSLPTIDEQWAEYHANNAINFAQDSSAETFFDLDFNGMSAEEAARERVLFARDDFPAEPVDLTAQDDTAEDAIMVDQAMGAGLDIGIANEDSEQGDADGIDQDHDDGIPSSSNGSDTIVVRHFPRSKRPAAGESHGRPMPKKPKFDISDDSSDSEYIDEASTRAGPSNTARMNGGSQEPGKTIPQSTVPLPAPPGAILLLSQLDDAETVTAPPLADTPSKPDTARLKWSYKSKYVLNLCCDSALPIPKARADRQTLVNAMMKSELDKLGFRQAFEIGEMESQYGQKNRIGRPGDSSWIDAGWKLIKDNAGDARDKAWRGAVATAVHGKARELGIAMV